MNAENRPILRIVRRLDAPPAAVFDMLTDPARMRVWWGADTDFDIDLRAGGQWTITRREGDETYVATGQYLDVQRPSRVQYTYAMPQFSPNTDTITITIEPQDGGSLVTFEQSGADIASELRDLPPGETSASEAGWQQGFDLMAAHLAKPA
jgi:uncharacterized protein YndB with AHSA1/START domain